MAEKIKEKAPVHKGLKEKVKAAPKELLRRGLLDGTQRLRGQLRDTAQRDQRDGYGGSQIEDAAWRGGRWGERGIEKLLKKKKGGRGRPGDDSPFASPESPSGEYTLPETPECPTPTGESERMRIKTREAVVSRDHGQTLAEGGRSEFPPAVRPEQRYQVHVREHAVLDTRRDVKPMSSDGTERPRIRTRETDCEAHVSTQPVSQAAPERPWIRTREISTHDAAGIFPDQMESAVSHSGKSPFKRSSIKTKDHYIQKRVVTPPERPAQTVEQRRRKFQREQGEKAAAKRFGERRAVPGSQTVLLEGEGKPPVQRSSPWRQIVQSGDVPISTKGRAASPAASSRKAVVKAPGADKKAVGRKAGQTVKTAKRGTKQALRSVDGVKVARNTAQTTSSAYKRAIQTFRATKKPAAATVRGAAKAGTAALKATVRAARTLAAALAAGGSVVVSVVLVLCLVGVLVASPFGIFFSDGSGSPDAVSPSAAAVRINGELSDYLSALQAGGTYDRVEILGQPPSWSDVFAVFAAKTTANGVDVVTLDTARVDILRAVFWDMTKVTTSEEEIEHPATGSTPAWTETVLKITITPRTTDDMRVFYSFTDEQNQTLDALLANGGMLTTLAGDLTVSSQNAKALLSALPADLDPERRAVVETACQLVGKVNYFWGGKSRVLGWDERWGQIKKVTASGSSTSGTYRPFGLDCSGFVDWVFYNVTGGSYIIGHGGGAHAQHTYCTAITWDQAIPGDLVFYPGDTHVGIVGGRDESGDLLIIHCASSKNNVVITNKSGFISIARPNYYSE